MANTNTDLTEEDAADLQFPKVDDDPSAPRGGTPGTASCSNVFDNDRRCCTNCLIEVISQYVMCEVCGVDVCLECFSKGVEFLQHKNDHDYRIMTTNFVLFKNSDWTAEEELILLDSIQNYGNWNMVAVELPNRSVKEIIEHYDRFYLDRNRHEGLPTIKKCDTAVFPPMVTPYRIKIDNTDEPPRYNSNTVGYKTLAGYNPIRSDFENEFDKGAEDILSNLEYVDQNDPHYELMTNLQCSLIRSYNRRLMERQRWKSVIRNHGLLVLRKIVAWLHRYDMTIQKPVYEKLIKFMQFCEPTKFEMLLEGLHKAGELQMQISRLINLRKQGIKSLAEARLYLKLQQIKEENQKSLKMFRSKHQFNWKSNKETAALFNAKSKPRRVSAPIDIIGMPGYIKLNEKEKSLCKNIRLVPATYLHLKDILHAEQTKNGYVKLQVARKLLKIDVNKTRRLYDFLVEEGVINKQ